MKNFTHKVGLLIFFLLIAPFLSFAELKNGMDADIVLGQPDFNTNSLGTTQSKISFVDGIYTDGHKFILGDFYNHRVLIWNSIPTQNGQPADIVLGQPNFTSNTPNNGGISARTISSPYTVTSDGKRLIVADAGNRRILIWNSIPSSSFSPADVVIGAPDFVTVGGGTSRYLFSGLQTGLATDGKKLFVADRSNNRVLIYNTIPTTNNAPADIVLGQPDFDSSTANNGGLSAKSMYQPHAVFTDGKKLFVAEVSNHRVLIWNSIPNENFTPADIVLGQPDFETNSEGSSADKMNVPAGIYSDGIRLFVGEFSNHRVLVWNKIPTKNGTPADLVLGQPDFNQVTANLGRNRMSSSEGNLAFDGHRLFVPDTGNRRVLIFNLAGISENRLGPQFEQGKAVLGKVFEDRNGNGWQDRDEKGLDGVKVVSDTGIYAITDEDGKYHFPYIETGQHVLKIDESTLPDGAKITTDNPMKVVVTEGVLTKVSFGVKLPASEVREAPAETSGPLLKVSMSQDASSLKPRLAVSAEQIRDKKDGKDKVVFTIDCNYYLFIKRAELKLYDSNEKEIKRIELPQPLPLKYEISLTELSGGTGLQSPDSRHLDHRGQVHYQLSVFDQKNKEDRTGIGSLTLVEPKLEKA